MNDTPCDHMIETEAPFCYLARTFPQDCKGCSWYLEEETPTDIERTRIWEMYVTKSATATRSRGDNNLGGQARRE